MNDRDRSQTPVMAMRCRVRGRVQGVSFRAASCTRGVELGLSGYARNMPDGSVEVYAHGDIAALTDMRAWLRRGPPSARVDELDCAEVPRETVDGFTIRG